MKNRFKFFGSLALGAIFVCSAAVFSACGQTGGNNVDNDEKEVYEEDDVKPIHIENDYAADKVVTQGFTVGDVTEDKNAFSLPKLVGNNMLLQANVTTKVWGETQENGAVAAQILKENGTVEATYYGNAGNGSFEIYLGAHDYGTNYTVRLVTAGGKSVSVKNVAFGELWIGGGQSNMGWEMRQCYRGNTSRLLYQKEIDNSENDEIRLFHVYYDKNAAKDWNTPAEEIASATPWQTANPETVAPFSAAGYFFAKELNEKYSVPVGVIMSCMGGTPIYTWLPENAYSEGVVGTSDSAEFKNSLLYNGMIYPLRNLTVRGVLWYQGEGDYNSYDVNYGLLMKGWRKAFGQDKMWFTTVTLPRYPDADSYYKCRAQQTAASVKDPYATYSVNIDCGLLPKDVAKGNEDINPQGIHPYDKKPIGERAAHVTMKDLYGAKGVWSGPVVKSVKVKGNTVTVTFSNVGKGLALQGKNGFELADAGNPVDLYEATSVRIVDTNKVEISCDKVKNPVKIVYGRVNADLDAIESYAECVCLYNTKGDDAHIAYPAEQFERSLK